jgi:hypothetical protein
VPVTALRLGFRPPQIGRDVFGCRPDPRLDLGKPGRARLRAPVREAIPQALELALVVRFALVLDPGFDVGIGMLAQALDHLFVGVGGERQRGAECLAGARVVGPPFLGRGEAPGLPGEPPPAGAAAPPAGDGISAASSVSRSRSRIAIFAMEILQSLPRINSSALVFTVNGNIAYNNFNELRNRIHHLMGGDVPHWQIRDLRRTATTLMAEIGIAHHVADKILNHSSGKISGVAAIYNRHKYLDERKAAMNILGRKIATIIGRDPELRKKLSMLGKAEEAGAVRLRQARAPHRPPWAPPSTQRRGFAVTGH